MKILGFIPARGGSKSIPHKNIADLNSKPLLFYTCEAAKKSKKLNRIILDTDDPQIAGVGKRYGAESPFLRPKALARDKTLILDVILYALQRLKKEENYEPDIFVLLQPTSPLRTFIHIDKAINLLIKSKSDSVVSVTEVPHQFNPVSVMKLTNGNLVPLRGEVGPLRRQDKPKVYGRNGPAVLAVWTSVLTKMHSLYGKRIKPLIMKREESVDIDSFFDLKWCEYLLKSSKKRKI